LFFHRRCGESKRRIYGIIIEIHCRFRYARRNPSGVVLVLEIVIHLKSWQVNWLRWQSLPALELQFVSAVNYFHPANSEASTVGGVGYVV
jgi:hypothetical protein